MSYLLDALRKSERERNLGKIPRFDSIQQTPPAPSLSKVKPKPVLPKWKLLVFLNTLVLLVLAGYFFLLYFGNSKDIAERPAGESRSSLVSQADDQPPAKSPDSFTEKKADKPVDVPILSAERLDDGIGTEKNEKNEKNAKKVGVKQEEQVSPSADSRPSSLKREAPALSEASQPYEPIYAEPEASSNYANTSKEALRWQDLPVNIRERINPPRLEVHAHSEQAERRFVFINGNLYREGDRLPDDLRIVEINKSGAVLAWQGNHFLLER